jgi:uncharacterized protein (TIGR03437 family)
VGVIKKIYRLGLLMWLGASLSGLADGATTPIPLQISAESAPAGGSAQIKIYAVKPGAIASGHVVLNLDATAFGPGAMVGLFGANGDATGLATVTGPLVDVQFSSATGGIAEVAGLPVMVVSVPVLASAAGRTVAVTATSPDGSVSVASGSVRVQGTLSIQKIPAGMGVVGTGTIVPVLGSGFTASTTVEIDGVVISSVQFVSAQEIDVTIGGATELVGKRVRVRDGGVEFDYFCFQPNDAMNFSEAGSFGSVVANVQPLFPLFASTGITGYSDYTGDVIEVQNPNSAATMVTVSNVQYCCGPPQTGPQQALAIPPGSWAFFDGGARTTYAVNSNLPVRVVSMSFCNPPAAALRVCLATPLPYDAMTALAMTPSSLVFAWQKGDSTVPGARTVSLSPVYAAIVSIAATTASGGSWLSVAKETWVYGAYSVSASVDPSQLAVGTYQGSIVVTQVFGPPATLPVSLTVTAAAVPVISATPRALSFTAPDFNAAPYAETIALASDSGPAPFSVALEQGTWLKVSPMSGTTPAVLTVTWDPSVTSRIYYQQRSTPASMVISGPGNTITVAATFNVTGVQTFQTFLGESGAGPNGLVFSAQTGSAPQMQTINVDPAGGISATADQAWIAAVAPASGTVAVTVNPAGLAAGVYQGAVTVAAGGLASKVVPVTLGVWSSPPRLTVTPGSLTLVQTVGEQASPQSVLVSSGGVPVPFTIALGASWLSAVDSFSAPTPATVAVGAANAPGSPGEYDGSFTVQSAGSSVYVPVTLLVEPGRAAPPVVSQVVNAASGLAGSVSPGEILTIRGYGAGAPAVGGVRLDPSGNVVAQVNGLRVLFDGQAAPLIYTSANQTNVIVPYEVAGQGSTTMALVYAAATGTLQTAAWVLPVAPSSPGVFTVDATGTGQGSVVNQDGTVNSASNPAAAGSVVSIYATGAGQTSPAGVTGGVAGSDPKAPELPVTVTIGGVGATVQYAGSAPGEVEGLMQVNAVVPLGVGPGPAVPVVVSVGGVSSQAGVTVAMK